MSKNVTEKKESKKTGYERPKLYHAIGTITFRGFCRSENDPNKKNRFTVELDGDISGTDDIRKMYDDNSVPDDFVPGWVNGERRMSFSSEFPIVFYDASNKKVEQDPADEGAIYYIEPGSKVDVAFKLIPREGKKRIGCYCVAVKVLEMAAPFNPFE